MPLALSKSGIVNHQGNNLMTKSESEEDDLQCHISFIMVTEIMPLDLFTSKECAYHHKSNQIICQEQIILFCLHFLVSALYQFFIICHLTIVHFYAGILKITLFIYCMYAQACRGGGPEDDNLPYYHMGPGNCTQAWQ